MNLIYQKQNKLPYLIYEYDYHTREKININFFVTQYLY